MQNALAGQAGIAFANPGELNDLIKSDAEFSTVKTRRYIRLEDTKEGQRTICPIVYLDGDFSRKHPRLCLQLIIITHTELQDDQAECLLLRFETPEGSDPAGTGKHDYYHSQLCTDLRIDGPSNTVNVPGCVSWRAVSCPAWPIDAKTPLHLLACVVFALYGKANGMRILRGAYGDSLDKLIADMHFSFPSPSVRPSRARTRQARKKRKSKNRK
jgi:hypothetical protein